MSDQKSGTALAAGTALGLGIAAFLGVGLILAFLLFRRREENNLGVISALPAPPRSHAPLGMLGAGISTLLPAPQGVSRETAVRTYTLPSLTITGADAFRLASAPIGEHHRVTVRVISPQGGLAVLAFSANALNSSSSLDGGTMVIPTGQHQDIRLPAGQSLYGKGHVPGVMVSVVQAEG